MANTTVNQFRLDGYCLFPEVYSPTLLAKLRTLIDMDLDEWAKIMSDRGRSKESGVVAHHALIKQHWIDFMDLLEPYGFYSQVLNSAPVVSAFGVLDNCKTESIYVHANHIDQRFQLSTSETIMLNILIFVDEFTVDTGATWLYPGSHRGLKQVEDESAIQVVGSAGSVLAWDSRLLHRAGENLNGQHRRAISLMLTRPWLKPQFDYSYFVIRNSMQPTSDKAAQLLGLKSRIPKTLEEWYPIDGNRIYDSHQDDWIAE